MINIAFHKSSTESQRLLSLWFMGTIFSFIHFLLYNCQKHNNKRPFRSECRLLSPLWHLEQRIVRYGYTNVSLTVSETLYSYTLLGFE